MTVAVGGPVPERVVVVAVPSGTRTQSVSAAERRVFIGVYGVDGPSARHLALATADPDGRGVSRLVDGDPVQARPQHGERQVGRVDLVGLGIIEAPYANENRARAHLNLRDVVAQIQER